MHWFHSDEVTWLDSRLGPWRNEFKFPIRSIIQISLISIELVIVTVSSVPQSNADYRFGEFKGAKFCVIFITVSQKILNSFNIWITNPPKISKPKTHIYIEIFWKKKKYIFSNPPRPMNILYMKRMPKIWNEFPKNDVVQHNEYDEIKFFNEWMHLKWNE